MRTHSLIPASTATAFLMVITLSWFGSGCGRDEGNPLAPTEQLQNVHQAVPPEAVQSTLPEASGSSLASGDPVRQLCEQLRVAGSESEAKAIWEGMGCGPERADRSP